VIVLTAAAPSPIASAASTRLYDATAKTGKVKKQSLKPGTILAPGATVNVTFKP
jgi:beta-lactam-binding protein with PASTA domain